MTEEWNREKSLLLDRITELEDQAPSDRSCSTCMHHNICRTAFMMLKFTPRFVQPETFNQFAKDLRSFLGDKCPYYMGEEIDDDI